MPLSLVRWILLHLSMNFLATSIPVGPDILHHDGFVTRSARAFHPSRPDELASTWLTLKRLHGRHRAHHYGVEALIPIAQERLQIEIELGGTNFPVEPHPRDYW